MATLYTFRSDSATWPSNDITIGGGLNDMIANSKPVLRKRFISVVDTKQLNDLEIGFGYKKTAKGTEMAADESVTYHSSHHHGERVYYFMRLGIAYIFTNTDL